MYDKTQAISGKMDVQLAENRAIMSETGKVRESAETIKTATEEQKRASQEISTSIMSINDLSQSHAAYSSSVADNAREIARIAGTLKASISD